MERLARRPDLSAPAPIEAETRATIKRVLLELEEMAALPPSVALEPLRFNAARARVMRSLWNLVKLAVRNGDRRL